MTDFAPTDDQSDATQIASSQTDPQPVTATATTESSTATKETPSSIPSPTTEQTPTVSATDQLVQPPIQKPDPNAPQEPDWLRWHNNPQLRVDHFMAQIRPLADYLNNPEQRMKDFWSDLAKQMGGDVPIRSQPADTATATTTASPAGSEIAQSVKAKTPEEIETALNANKVVETTNPDTGGPQLIARLPPAPSAPPPDGVIAKRDPVTGSPTLEAPMPPMLPVPQPQTTIPGSAQNVDSTRQSLPNVQQAPPSPQPAAADISPKSPFPATKGPFLSPYDWKQTSDLTHGGFLYTPEDEKRGNQQQCTALVKRLTGAGQASDWVEGDKLTEETVAKLKPGTGIATFVDGKYPSKHGYHAAVVEKVDYDEQNKPVINVIEQWAKQTPRQNVYRLDDTTPQTNASRYSVIMSK